MDSYPNEVVVDIIQITSNVTLHLTLLVTYVKVLIKYRFNVDVNNFFRHFDPGPSTSRNQLLDKLGNAAKNFEGDDDVYLKVAATLSNM